MKLPFGLIRSVGNFRVYKWCTLKLSPFVALYCCTPSFPILNNFIYKTLTRLLCITQFKMNVVAIAGAGNVGRTIVETLVKSSTYKVIVLGRKVRQ